MTRKPIGDAPMTPAERQAKYRAARAAAQPIIRRVKPGDHRGRAARWRDAVAELVGLQQSYQAWLDNLPEPLHGTATAEALREICDIDLSDLVSIVPPRGFGRD
jgi:hypothetical protein